jgi:L-threonylcarbamoyladenylate synthase
MPRTTPSAQVLSALQPADLAHAAAILADGGVVALPFNGMFALFGDLEQPYTHARILRAKGRTPDRRLALVTLPEFAHELADFSNHDERKIKRLWLDVHGLGIILKANRRAQSLLARVQPTDGTVLLVWTEYPPMRRVLEHFRALGGRALFGTSANRSGLATATTTRDVWRDFFTEVDAVVADEFGHLPAHRRQSMTVLDLTSEQPRLHGLGSVRAIELQAALTRHGLGTLRIGPTHIPRATDRSPVLDRARSSPRT